MFSKVRASRRADHEIHDKDDKNEVSLTSILHSQSLRTDFALLVALSTDAIRNDLLIPFDVPNTNNPSKPLSSARSPIPPAEDDPTSLDGPEKQATAAVDRQWEEYKRELSSPQMQSLRRAALSFFDAWQIGVLRRLGEVVGVRSEAVRQARRQHAASNAASAKENREKQYLDWANGKDEVKDEGSPNQHVRSSPIPTRLAELDEPKRLLLVHCLLLLLLSLEHYPAHSRVLLQCVTHSLLLDSSILGEHEKSVAQGLLAAASTMNADESTKKAAAADSTNRKWKIGLATVAGAALIGVTGGLAAPILAAGVGTVMGGLGLGATALSGLLGTLAGSSVLIGGLFGAYGGRMTGRVMEKYAKEVEDFKFIPLDSDTSQHRLRVAIVITGWLIEEAEVTKPWSVLGSTGIEPFALRWELDALLRLGLSLSSILKSAAWQYAKYEIVRRTLLSSLYAGLWPLGLVEAAKMADSPFHIAKVRADKAGRVLADALMEKCQGERPVTLVGYSLGARVIYCCLLSLAEHNAFGLIESAVLMGAPTPSSAKGWARIRAVVTGRVVNVFSTEDYILGFLYRTSSIQLGVAGLQAVEGVCGVENVDVSQLVKGHMKYRYAVGQILQKIGFEDVDDREVAKEIELLKALEQKERKEESETAMNAKTDEEGRVESQEDERPFMLESIEKIGVQGQNEVDADQDTLLAARAEKLQVGSKGPVEDDDVSDYSDAEPAAPIQMVDMDPVPEPDEIEHDPERVRFGSPDRGFDVIYGKR